MTRRLCRLAALPDGESRGFDGGPDELPARFFLVRQGDEVKAYRNRCPHTGVPMEWQPHRFMDLTGCYIVCGVHGALFRPRDGFCISGPCKGRFLNPLTVHVSDGWVWIEEDA